MKSYEALEKVIGRKTIEFAKRLRLSSSLVHKWTEPSTEWTDSGALNPLDRIEHIIEIALTLGVPQEDAFAPLKYLTERFGFILVSLPETKETKSIITPKDLAKIIKEFGEVVESASKALDDGKITPREAIEIEKEAWELIRQVASFVQRVNFEVFKEK